jgi:hypothetical protein
MSGPFGRVKIGGFQPQPIALSETAIVKRRSPARGILIGLVISSVLWIGIVYLVRSVVGS